MLPEEVADIRIDPVTLTPVSPMSPLVAMGPPPPSAPPPPSRSGRRFGRILKPLTAAAVIFGLAFMALSYQVPAAQWEYANAKPTPNPPGVKLVAAPPLVIPPDPTITIPKINVHAPVVYGAATDDDSFQAALVHGVVHYTGSALPGEPGNVVIFGHSSNDWWEPGDYKFIFVLLDKLEVGDKIGIDYQSKRHYYVVTDKKIVEPTDVEVMNPTDVPVLTLITCTPPGTSYKRLVVRAREANPAPRTVAVVTDTPSPTPVAPVSGQLIGSNSFMAKVRNIFAGIADWFTG